LILNLSVAFHEHEFISFDELLVISSSFRDEAGFFEDTDQFASLHLSLFQ